MHRQHKSLVSHKYAYDAVVSQQQRPYIQPAFSMNHEIHHSVSRSVHLAPRFVQDLTLKHGWRTGAIIPELRKEIKIMNTEQYMHMMAWLQALTGLIEQMQVGEDL